MTRWIARAVAANEYSAFAQFELSNRRTFERFNEPHSPSHYNAIGLTRAFACCLDQHVRGRETTRVVVADGSTQWLGMGRLRIHTAGSRPWAFLVYQTDHRFLRQGVAKALLADLIEEGNMLGLTRLEAQITWDNPVSLHLLRRAGFSAVGWAAPATLRRGRVDCLLLGRSVRTVAAAPLPCPHMHLPA